MWFPYGKAISSMTISDRNIAIVPGHQSLALLGLGSGRSSIITYINILHLSIYIYIYIYIY